MDVFDCIIVGAGTAGCALARRISDDSTRRVLLVEAGPNDTSPWFRIPVGYYKTVGNKKYDWGYSYEPEANLHGRRISCPRAKVIGGCGAVNGLIYTRGYRNDFDRWAADGAEGWAWSDVEPFFRAIEKYNGKLAKYGTGGLLTIARQSTRMEISKSFLAAAEVNGLPLVDDFSGPYVAGVGYPQTTVEGRW